MLPLLNAVLPIVFCRISSTQIASSWPEISVTYWKEEKKPRRSLPAISDR